MRASMAVRGCMAACRGRPRTQRFEWGNVCSEEHGARNQLRAYQHSSHTLAPHCVQLAAAKQHSGKISGTHLLVVRNELRVDQAALHIPHLRHTAGRRRACQRAPPFDHAAREAPGMSDGTPPSIKRPRRALSAFPSQAKRMGRQAKSPGSRQRAAGSTWVAPPSTPLVRGSQSLTQAPHRARGIDGCGADAPRVQLIPIERCERRRKLPALVLRQDASGEEKVCKHTRSVNGKGRRQRRSSRDEWQEMRGSNVAEQRLQPHTLQLPPPSLQKRISKRVCLSLTLLSSFSSRTLCCALPGSSLRRQMRRKSPVVANKSGRVPSCERGKRNGMHRRGRCAGSCTGIHSRPAEAAAIGASAHLVRDKAHW